MLDALVRLFASPPASFFFAVALIFAGRGRWSRDELAPALWCSNSWQVPSESRPALQLLCRAGRKCLNRQRSWIAPGVRLRREA